MMAIIGQPVMDSSSSQIITAFQVLLLGDTRLGFLCLP